MPQVVSSKREDTRVAVLVLPSACVPRHASRFAFRLVEQHGLAVAIHHALKSCADIAVEHNEEDRPGCDFTLAALAEMQRTTREAGEMLN